MKFCPECGSQLPIGTAKYCSNCGKSLWVTTSETEESKEEKNISEQFEKGEEHQQIKGDFQNQTVHSLGIKLEETVEQIHKDRGYTTETRKKMIGSSKALHEIDILAKRQNKVLAIECKNYNESRIVGIKEIRDFQSKLQDLPEITDGMFVTNTNFSSEAETYAKHNQISLYDGEKLKNDFYLMNIGRLESLQEIVLDFSLPITINNNEATRLNLVNPTAGRIARATLILNPFYVFDCVVDVKKGLFRGTFHEEGVSILDALTGEILTRTEDSDKKKNQTSYSFFSKSRIHPKDSEELLSDIEKNQIIVDLRAIKPISKYKIDHIGKYAVIKHGSKVPIDAARRMVKEEIIEEKNLSYDSVQIVDRASSCIYVPKWVINIESQNSVYTREILAASNTVLMDEIAFCPHEFFARFRPSRRETYAICERCGGAYCSRHIERVHNSYFCREHG